MRTIVEEKWTSDAIDKARETWSGADLAWDTLTWMVVRDPEAGTKVSPSGLTRARTLHGAKSIFMPTLTVLYKTEEHRIIVYDALFAEPTQWRPQNEG